MTKQTKVISQEVEKQEVVNTFLNAKATHSGTRVELLAEIIKDAGKVNKLMILQSLAYIAGVTKNKEGKEEKTFDRLRDYKAIANVSDATIKSISYSLYETVGNKTQSVSTGQFTKRLLKQFVDNNISQSCFFVGQFKSSSKFYKVFISVQDILDKLAATELILETKDTFEREHPRIIAQALETTSTTSSALRDVPDLLGNIVSSEPKEETLPSM